MSNPLYHHVTQLYGICVSREDIQEYIRTLDKSDIHGYDTDRDVTKAVNFIHNDNEFDSSDNESGSGSEVDREIYLEKEYERHREWEIYLYDCMYDIGSLNIKLPGTDRVMVYICDDTYTSAKGEDELGAFGLVYWSNHYVSTHGITIVEDFKQNPEVIAKFDAYIQEKFGRLPEEVFVHS